MTISEQIADRLTGGKYSELGETAAELGENNRKLALTVEMIKESMQRLEQTLYSPTWRRLAAQAEEEFTVEGIHTIIKLSRIMGLKNTVIKRGVEVKRLYVWAQGVQIAAVDPDINLVIQDFLKDEKNKQELTSHQARGEREEALTKEGNIFFRFFVNKANGRVRVRSIDPTEIVKIVCNPDDKKQPWFYKRTFTKTQLNGRQETITKYYPDWRYNPISRPAPEGWFIDWDTPVYHVKVNPVGAWGIPETYASMDWALAYKRFLEQLATVWEALARWAFKLTTKQGSKGVAAAKKKLNTTAASDGVENNPPPAPGSFWIQSDQVDMQPFKTSGATMSAEDGRRILLMGIMNAGFPETFYGDVSTGNLATAKTLDRPTELLVMDRQSLWGDVLNNILEFVIMWAAKAPKGPLKTSGLVKYQKEKDGREWLETLTWLTRTEDTGSEVGEEEVEVDPTVNVEFPAIIESDLQQTVGAIIDASNMKGKGNGIPEEVAVRRLLVELGFGDVDKVMELWRELQEERKAKAEEMAAQFAAGGDKEEDAEEDEEDDAEEDETAAEAARDHFYATMNTLIDQLGGVDEE